jgi:hypothetical protein
MFLRTAPAPQTSSAQAESLLPGGIVGFSTTKGWAHARAPRHPPRSRHHRAARRRALAVPGGRPGHPLNAGRISDRLKAIGLHPRADRAAALLTLAAELPAAILARTLGITIRTAAGWQKAASGDWMAYSAAVSRRSPGSGIPAAPGPSRHWRDGR